MFKNSYIISPYENTTIYKICCNDKNITNTYVGLTINFKNRKRTHELACNNLKKGKLYDFIRNNGGWSNWEMEVLENCACINRKEAGLREQYWFESLNSNLNNNHPSRTSDKWYEDNKERLLELQRIWRTNKKNNLL
jgi:hypothetical protein